ncbi:MAG: ACP S-malonyltransferase [Sphingorhabdus sp.]
MRQTALVVCPGRGTYNTTELGYLKTHHATRGDLVERLDALRRSTGQIPISELDGTEKFSPATHMTGDNASLLIYACALADFAAIDRDRYDIVAVTGNSMGWYLALTAAGVLDFDGGARLVNNMGSLMHQHGAGGQIVWPIVDADWNVDSGKENLVSALLAEASINSSIQVHISIRLGGMVVFAADDAGLKWLSERLPKDDRFPMRLMHHAAFHSPLLDHILPMAQAANPLVDFRSGAISAIDGQGRVWSSQAFDVADIYGYTLGTQLNRTYDFTRSIQVAAAEFAPDRIILLGPGTTLGAPVAQALIASGWRGLSGKADFLARQISEPLILSMGIADQRTLVTG